MALSASKVLASSKAVLAASANWALVFASFSATSLFVLASLSFASAVLKSSCALDLSALAFSKLEVFVVALDDVSSNLFWASFNFASFSPLTALASVKSFDFFKSACLATSSACLAVFSIAFFATLSFLASSRLLMISVAPVPSRTFWALSLLVFATSTFFVWASTASLLLANSASFSFKTSVLEVVVFEASCLASVLEVISFLVSSIVFSTDAIFSSVASFFKLVAFSKSALAFLLFSSATFFALSASFTALVCFSTADWASSWICLASSTVEAVGVSVTMAVPFETVTPLTSLMLVDELSLAVVSILLVSLVVVFKTSSAFVMFELAIAVAIVATVATVLSVFCFFDIFCFSFFIFTFFESYFIRHYHYIIN